MATKNEVAKATKNEVMGDFKARVLAAAQAEQEVRAQSGSNLTWITGPISGDSGFVEPTSADYIKGAKKNGYVIKDKKINLGTTFNAIPIGMFKVFAEQTIPQGSEMSKTVSYWLPEDAAQIPTGDNNFEHPLSNGNVLKPVHWIFLYLPSHPEIKGVVLSFRSTANSIYSAFEKVLKGRSKICPEVMLSISSQGIENKKYKKTYYYPKLEIDEQRNFALTDSGIKSVAGGLDKDTLKDVLDRYCELQEAFKAQTVVAKKANIAGYLAEGDAGSAFDDMDDAEEAEIRF